MVTDQLEMVAHPDELDERWAFWDAGYATGPILARRLDETRYVAIVPFLFTWGLIVGPTRCTLGYDDRWCYRTLSLALAAATVWDGTGEPQGWHRHPDSGRRRPDGDPTRQYVNP